MMILGYWSVRGRGSAIKNLLRYVQADYCDVTYPLEGPHYSREEWFKVKYLLGLDFPNLPYLIDGNLKLTQVCWNICIYLIYLFLSLLCQFANHATMLCSKTLGQLSVVPSAN